MRNPIFLVLLLTLLSCEPKTTTDISSFIKHSREQLANMGYTAGWTTRDSDLVKEYDNLARIAGTPELQEAVSQAKFLKTDQKGAIGELVNLNTEADVIKLALLNSYTSNIHDYRLIIDHCQVNFTPDGIVHLNFINSALRRSVSYATNKQDYENGNLIERDFEYGSSELLIRNLTSGDSVFWLLFFPIFQQRNCKVWILRNIWKTISITYAMNEWGYINQDIFVGIGKSATSFNFK